MQAYERFQRNLTRLLGEDTAVRIQSKGYMPLSIERIGRSAEGREQIAISHTYVQNGDLMRDPEIVFEIVPGLGAEPISFLNDGLGRRQEVYVYNPQGRRTHIRPQLQRQLRSFSSTWFRNLREQGFFAKDALRERLA